MTIRQRIFYLIGIYVFCGYLRIFVKETARVMVKKFEETKAKQDINKPDHGQDPKEDPIRYGDPGTYT